MYYDYFVLVVLSTLPPPGLSLFSHSLQGGGGLMLYLYKCVFSLY